MPWFPLRLYTKDKNPFLSHDHPTHLQVHLSVDGVISPFVSWFPLKTQGKYMHVKVEGFHFLMQEGEKKSFFFFYYVRFLPIFF